MFQAYRVCPSSSQLPVYYADAIRGVSGVKEVLPVKVVVSNCRASTDTVVFNGVDPKLLPSVRPNLRFLSGDWAAFQARNDAALVGRRIAERRGLKPGQSFTVAGVTVQVAGVFASDGLGEENLIYTHLTLLGLNPSTHHDYHATLFEVHLNDPAQAETVATAIDAKLKEKFEVPTETKPQKAHYASALADLLDLISMTQWLGSVCVGVVVAGRELGRDGRAGPSEGTRRLADTRLFRSANRVVDVDGELSHQLRGRSARHRVCPYLMWKPMSLSTEGVTIDFLLRRC